MSSILTYFKKKQPDSDSGATKASKTGENVQERTNNFCKEEVKEGSSKSHIKQMDFSSEIDESSNSTDDSFEDDELALPKKRSHRTVIHGTDKNMPKEPPNKKLKQTDLQSSSQQSPIKTTRDNESGETSQASDNVQKTTAHSVKKEAEEGPSKDLQQEIEVNFRLNSRTYSVPCKTSMTVLEALNTSKKFEIEKNKNLQKEILIQRSIGEYCGAIKTDFPCCLIEKDEILEITFIKKDENGSTSQTTADSSPHSKISKPKTLVAFFVDKVGGPTVTCLLKSKALRESVRYVCVFAFKGEDIKTALKRDGRFRKVIYKKHCALSGPKRNHELSTSVTKTLNKNAFQVVVISETNLPDSQDAENLVKTEPNVASDTDAAENVGPSQNPINIKKEKKQDGNTTKSTNPSTKRYVVKRIDKSEEILGILRDQSKDLWETVKKREELKNMSEVQGFFRTEYHKSVENFSKVKKVKELMRLSDSVCQIRAGGSAVGTGFLLFDRFILTNAHVIGKSTDLTKLNIAQFTAVFDYEDLNSEIKCIPVKELTAYSYGNIRNGRHLDYALLELDAFNEKYPQLLSCYSPNTTINSGGICIVGHPHEAVKKMDPCIIIETGKRLEAENKHKSENKTLIPLMTQKSVEEKWNFFENQITYDSCFFHGSSGSPVFDVDCNLIGIHTGGYVYQKDKKKTWSVMEYSFTMQPILDNIRARAKIKGLKEIVEILEPYSSDQQNQTDTVMEDDDESEEP